MRENLWRYEDGWLLQQMRRKNGDRILSGRSLACRVYSAVRRKETKAQALKSSLRYLRWVREHWKYPCRKSVCTKMNSRLQQPRTIKAKFILCPVCGNKTRVQIREDTELKNFPLFCPKCHKQTLINAKQLNITKAEVPDAKTQSRWTCEIPHSSSALLLSKNLAAQPTK